ncbi:MAG: lamin tail domain-containing protein [Prolixibacteraceae bacterium]|nr:lamin tail domain-containing protein [Prolixibacteraceae bacterium]
MPLRILIYTLFLTLILSKSLNGQMIWHEVFNIPNKGIWADSSGNIYSDFTNIKWSVDTSSCSFDNENDYAKTVSTSGGRFEVLDSDGEITWKSQTIEIESYDLINIAFTASETGSSSVESKKYVKAFYELDDTLYPFSPYFSVSGNWGEKILEQKSINGNKLRVVIKMNSSYANDKVIIDDIKVEAVDKKMLEPERIQITRFPGYTFADSMFSIGAIILNGNDEPIVESSIPLMLTFNNTQRQIYPDSTGNYIWHIKTGTTGSLNITIGAPGYKMDTAHNTVTVFSPDNISTNINFENNTIPTGFSFFNNWEISSSDPLSGKYSIKHKPNENGGTDSLNYLPENSIGKNNDEIIVSFMLKNGDWDPSGSNTFYSILTPQNSGETALAIGVNAKGSTDLFSAWTIENKQPATLLAETNFNWNHSQTAQITITRKPGGKWFLSATDQDSDQSVNSTFNFHDFSELSKLQLIFNHTKTRSGLLWFDDLLILSKNAPPKMLSAKTIDAGQFEIVFSEPIDTTGLTTNNFKIKASNGETYSIDRIKIFTSNTIHLYAENAPREITLLTIAQNIADTDGLKSGKDTICFNNFVPARHGDIVINEVMADPTPVVQLPEEEYIEVFNRSDQNISLLNWTITVRNTTRTITDSLILAPGEYLIICKNDNTESFRNYGKCYGLEGFPALLNSGAKISLHSNEQRLIDEISYDPSWHHSPEKKNGGYSLERIDANRFCAQAYNWSSSENETGGTPGHRNSISKENIDSEPPYILTKNIKSLNEMEVLFSEPIDTSNTSSININCDQLQITSIEIEKATLTIEVSPAFTNKNRYSLNISNISDECGNMANMFEISILINTPGSNDLLINELLFNPVPDGDDFIEFYNNSRLPVDLSLLYLATRDDSLTLKSVARIASQETLLQPKCYYVVTTNPLHLFEQYNIPDNQSILKIGKLPPMYNTEGRVVLLNDSLEVVDEVYYHESMHSDWLYDNEGVSLERISIMEPSNATSNWQSASSLAGFATPGYKNSQYIDGPKLNDIKVELKSDIVSPNGDNYNDELVVNITGNASGYLINLFVFDVNGIEKKRVLNNELAGTHNEIIYNLENNNGLLLQDGSYILYLEMTHLKKEAYTCKKAFYITQ